MFKVKQGESRRKVEQKKNNHKIEKKKRRNLHRSRTII